MAYTWTSELRQYADGAYRIEVEYSISGGSISATVVMSVETEFSSKQKVRINWNDTTGGALVKSWENRQISTTSFVSHTITTNARNLSIEVVVGNEQGTTTGGDRVTVPTYVSGALAPNPTGITATKISNVNYQLVVTGDATTYNVTNIVIERAEDTGSFSSLTEIQGNWTGPIEVTYNDRTTSEHHKYMWRVRFETADGEESGWVTSNSQYTQPTTDATLEVQEQTLLGKSVRVLTWEIGSAAGIGDQIMGWTVLVEENGTGLWLPIGVVPAIPFIYTYKWMHIPIAGTTSRYRLQAFGQGGLAINMGGATSEYTAPPSKPKKVTAYRNPDVEVVINIEDVTSNTAEDVKIERNENNAVDAQGNLVWNEIASISFMAENQYVDTTAIGLDVVQYRVRNANEKGFSAYIMTGQVPLLSKPNPPYLASPYYGANVMIDDNYVQLVFRHSPTDGTPQRQAQLQWRRNSGTWNTVSLYTEGTYTLSLGTCEVNDIIEWKVRTLGNYDEWSDWSSSQFKLLRQPQIRITSPQNASSITAFPVVLGWTYNDDSGVMTDMTIQIIKDADVEAEYKPDFGDGTTGTYSYPITGFLFDNNTDYEIRVVAQSTTGFEVQHSIGISIEYSITSAEGSLIPSIYGDKDTGYVNIIVSQDISEDVTPKDIVEAYIYRIHEGQKELVGEIFDGAQIVDKLAPLNVDYEYELVMLTDESEIILSRYGYRLDSPYSYIYFGEETFRGKWNQEHDISLDRPERVEKRYSGRKYPVSYDSLAIEETCGYTTVLTDRAELVRLKKLMRNGNGQGIWKSTDGDAYHANFKLSYKTNAYMPTQTWDVSVEVTRIED